MKINSKFIIVVVALFAVFAGVGCYYGKNGTVYQEQEGDIIFQSLPRNELVKAIEGCSESEFSHCGIVMKKRGKWVVREAMAGGVKTIPLYKFILRGRCHHFAVYRLKPKYQDKIPEFITASATYTGLPYDLQYGMGDDKIYCSELIYKSWFNVTGEKMGNLRKLGDMPWQPHEKVIRTLDLQHRVPLEREMITPIDLSKAPQLEKVYSEGF